MLKEGYLLSDKTISVDFQNIKDNKMLIVGLSGSGKTTLGKKLSKHLNMKLRSTDDCPFDWHKFKSNPKLKEKILNDYWDCCSKMLLDNKKGILEGVGIIEVYERRPSIRRSILKFPCIIIGASALKSSYRANKQRGKDKAFNLFFYEVNFKLYQKMLNKFRKDRTNITGAQVKEYNVSKMTENKIVENYLKEIQ